MAAINMQNAADLILDIARVPDLDYDGFEELAAKRRTEIFSTGDGYGIVRNSQIDNTWDVANAARFDDLNSACTFLRQKENVVLSVKTERCFLSEIKVPAKAASKIGHMVKLEIERITPFTTDQVYYGYYRSVESADQINAVFCILRKDAINPVIEKLHANGVFVAALVVRDAQNNILPVALAPTGGEFGARRFSFWSRLTLACSIAVVMSAVALAITIWDLQTSQSSEITHDTEVFAQAAAEVRARLDIEKKVQQQTHALSDLKLTLSNRSKILEELSHVLPEDLSQFGVAEQHVKLTNVPPTCHSVPDDVAPISQAIEFKGKIVVDAGMSELVSA